MQLKAFVLLALLPAAYAHFSLDFPTSIGFDDDTEGQYPCGGINFGNRAVVNDFPINGAPIALTSTHPENTWFFRAARLDDPENWFTLSPAIDQLGNGRFCAGNIRGPAGWEGVDGVLQVVANAPDGFLFQCAAVKFVGGDAISPSDESACRNDTKVTAGYVSDSLILDATTTQLNGVGPSQTGINGGSLTPNAAVRRDGALAVVGGIIGALGFFFA
ncbi:hypothetical protein H072_7599 [Dactylellina haptotyla CBS 200.50]|uniref:Copper acquisition factor BIM1-like domain-containing protein n=1 Tax=Dactylellina haptotyla (strain CBS 200.50) TaxID=1284197 RepID=S8BH43_DACHA|nr:hypothetical protein H072_7599 [Dactylellina haptotyla CBS 200.50]